MRCDRQTCVDLDHSSPSSRHGAVYKATPVYPVVPSSPPSYLNHELVPLVSSSLDVDDCLGSQKVVRHVKDLRCVEAPIHSKERWDTWKPPQNAAVTSVVETEQNQEERTHTPAHEDTYFEVPYTTA